LAVGNADAADPASTAPTSHLDARAPRGDHGFEKGALFAASKSAVSACHFDIP